MSDVEPTMDVLGAIVDRHAAKGYLHRDEVEPNFKGEPRAPKPRRRLPRVGKKGRNDARELRTATRIVRARSGGLCEVSAELHECTRRVTSPPHHIVRRSQGGMNDPSNLLDCCDNGHTWIHANPRSARIAGYLRSAP